MPTPLIIETMFACYCSSEPEQYMSDRWTSPPAQDARKWLQERGLVGDDMRATEKGKAWVDYILSTPLPKQQWVLPPRVMVDVMSGER